MPKSPAVPHSLGAGGGGPVLLYGPRVIVLRRGLRWTLSYEYSRENKVDNTPHIYVYKFNEIVFTRTPLTYLCYASTQQYQHTASQSPRQVLHLSVHEPYL